MITLHGLTGCASERTFSGSHEAHIAAYYDMRRVEARRREGRAIVMGHLRRQPAMPRFLGTGCE